MDFFASSLKRFVSKTKACDLIVDSQRRAAPAPIDMSALTG